MKVIKSSFDMELKVRVKNLLKEEGKSVADLYAFLGMTDSNYYANMKKASWNLRQLKKIADYFSCTLSVLLHNVTLGETSESNEPPLPDYPEKCKNCKRLEHDVEFFRQQNDRLLAIIDKMQNDK